MYGQTRGLWKKFSEEESQRQQASYLGLGRHERAEEERKDYGNGFYQREFVTRLGALRLSIARTRKKSFLPALLERFQRRAEEVMLLIREAFWRGISTRQVGRVGGLLDYLLRHLRHKAPGYRSFRLRTQRPEIIRKQGRPATGKFRRARRLAKKKGKPRPYVASFRAMARAPSTGSRCKSRTRAEGMRWCT